MHTELQKMEAAMQVMTLGRALKRKYEELIYPYTISFSEQDLDRLQLPHDDALVIEISIDHVEVWRILVDQGSSADVLYHSAYKAIGRTRDELTPSGTPLVGFSGFPVYPLGSITLPVWAGLVRLKIEFTVVDSPSPYNAILGRGWLHAKPIQCHSVRPVHWHVRAP